MEDNKQYKQHATDGLTLIEIVIVVALIGILSVAGVSTYVGALKTSRDARRKSDLIQIKSALELYRADNSKYPLALTTLAAQAKKYINIPTDPSNKLGYYYLPCLDSSCVAACTAQTCSFFKLGSFLETKTTPRCILNSCKNTTGATDHCTYCLDPYGEI